MTWRINPHKYNAKKVGVDGYTFDSLAEARRYRELVLFVKKGSICDLKIHPRFAIVHAGIKICTVILDFSFWDKTRGVTVYQDVKGMDTPISRLKRKLVKAFYGIDVEIIR